MVLVRACFHSVGSLVVGRGPTITFNLLRASGQVVGHSEVERLAAAHNIQLRVCAVF